MPGAGVARRAEGREGDTLCLMGRYGEGELRTHAVDLALRKADGTEGGAMNARAGLRQPMGQHGPRRERVEKPLAVSEGMLGLASH